MSFESSHQFSTILITTPCQELGRRILFKKITFYWKPGGHRILLILGRKLADDMMDLPEIVHVR